MPIRQAMKSDIYSLGIVIYQILNNERYPYDIIRVGLKKFYNDRLKYTDNSKYDYSNYTFLGKSQELLKKMLNYSPESRPKLDEIISKLIE